MTKPVSFEAVMSSYSEKYIKIGKETLEYTVLVATNVLICILLSIQTSSSCDDKMNLVLSKKEKAEPKDPNTMHGS